MVKKLILNPELLDVEYQMLKEELLSLDSLYEEAKERLDIVARNPTRANPVFMSSQTANLISIKEKRLNIIKELGNIKRTQMDIKAKEFTTNNKIDDNESGYSREALDIFKMLTNNRIAIAEAKAEESKTIEDNNYSDSELDDILSDRLSELTKDENTKKKNTQVLPSEYSIVVTEDKEKYIVDADYNIIEDCNYDLSLINIVRFETINDDEMYAYDEDDNAYEVVEF